MAAAYRIAAVGDWESVMGFRALGLETYPVTGPEEARETIRNLSDQAIPACIEDSRAVLSLREQLWMDFMRPQGFEVVNIRMSGVTARLAAAKRRLDL